MVKWQIVPTTKAGFKTTILLKAAWYFVNIISTKIDVTCEMYSWLVKSCNTVVNVTKLIGTLTGFDTWLC